jgi:transposase
LKAHIAKRKKLPKYAWWSALGSQAIQDIIERIDKGHQRFFQSLKDRKTHKTTQTIGPPTFRAIRKAKSFTLKQAGWKLLGGNHLRIGSTVYKFAKSRAIEGTIKTVTVKRDALCELYVFFSCVVPWFPSSKRCHVCGTLNACITLRDRIWTCVCGVTHQRDHVPSSRREEHAAINIFREGASSLGGSHVRLAAASNGC